MRFSRVILLPTNLPERSLGELGLFLNVRILSSKKVFRLVSFNILKLVITASCIIKSFLFLGPPNEILFPDDNFLLYTEESELLLITFYFFTS